MATYTCVLEVYVEAGSPGDAAREAEMLIADLERGAFVWDVREEGSSTVEQIDAAA